MITIVEWFYMSIRNQKEPTASVVIALKNQSHDSGIFRRCAMILSKLLERLSSLFNSKKFVFLTNSVLTTTHYIIDEAQISTIADFRH